MCDLRVVLFTSVCVAVCKHSPLCATRYMVQGCSSYKLDRDYCVLYTPNYFLSWYVLYIDKPPVHDVYMTVHVAFHGSLDVLYDCTRVEK